MGRRAFAITTAFLGIALLLWSVPGAAKCGIKNGARVALYGSFGDPDVFVWESRFRLEAYQTGTLDARDSLMPHARLAPPATRAVVLGCVQNYVHPKYVSTLDDAVYIKLLGGDYRGQTGWVMSSDLRVVLSRR